MRIISAFLAAICSCAITVPAYAQCDCTLNPTCYSVCRQFREGGCDYSYLRVNQPFDSYCLSPMTGTDVFGFNTTQFCSNNPLRVKPYYDMEKLYTTNHGEAEAITFNCTVTNAAMLQQFFRNRAASTGGSTFDVQARGCGQCVDFGDDSLSGPASCSAPIPSDAFIQRAHVTFNGDIRSGKGGFMTAGTLYVIPSCSVSTTTAPISDIQDGTLIFVTVTPNAAIGSSLSVLLALVVSITMLLRLQWV